MPPKRRKKKAVEIDYFELALANVGKQVAAAEAFHAGAQAAGPREFRRGREFEHASETKSPGWQFVVSELDEKGAVKKYPGYEYPKTHSWPRTVEAYKNLPDAHKVLAKEYPDMEIELLLKAAQPLLVGEDHELEYPARRGSGKYLVKTIHVGRK